MKRALLLLTILALPAFAQSRPDLEAAHNACIQHRAQYNSRTGEWYYATEWQKCAAIDKMFADYQNSQAAKDQRAKDLIDELTK